VGMKLEAIKFIDVESTDSINSFLVSPIRIIFHSNSYDYMIIKKVGPREAAWDADPRPTARVVIEPIAWIEDWEEEI